MRKTVLGMAVLVMAWASVSHAAVYDQVAAKDSSMESGDPDASMGDAQDNRLYPEFHTGDPEAKGVRPGLFQWDLSSIPTGSTIVSARLHLYLDREGNPGTVTGYYIRRLKPGKAWVESTAYHSPALTGETTWSYQSYNTVPWTTPSPDPDSNTTIYSTGGVRGAADVDIPNQVLFDASGGTDIADTNLDVTGIVTEWVTNGVENNGVILGGGHISANVTGGNRWLINFRENGDTTKRPHLTIVWFAAGTCSSVTPDTTQTKTGYELGASNSPFASVDLGGTGATPGSDVTDGLSTPYNAGDGLFTTTAIGGKSCHTATANYMYFDVTATLPAAGVTFTVTYYDTDNQSLNLEYDGTGSDYQLIAPLVDMTADGAGPGWKTATVNVADAQFANGENGGSDFRISGSANATFYLDTVLIAETATSVTYTVANLSGSSYVWTVSEVLSDGTTPTDYAWLTLSTAGGTLAGASNTPATAILNTATLTAAGSPYHAYLKFASDCDPPLVRQIDFNVIGCTIQVLEPRLRYPGPCVNTATTTEVFTIKNNGAHDWTGYNAAEDPENDDWISVSYTSAPVVRFATAPVTATIDWSLVPAPGNQRSTIKFGGTCDGGSTFVYDSPTGTSPIETVNVVDPISAPTIVLYNGGMSPSAAGSGGGGIGPTGVSFNLYEGLDQGTLVTDGGGGGGPSGITPTANTNDGAAYKLTDVGAAGQKTKWRSVLNGTTNSAIDIDANVGATALARMKIESNDEANNLGWNLAIQQGTVGAAFHYGSGTPAFFLRENGGAPYAVNGDFTSYHIMRVTSKDTNSALGVVKNVYFDESPIPVITVTNAGGYLDSGIEAISFGAASSLNAQVIYFDWLTCTNAGAFAPGDEDACIGASLIPQSYCTHIPRMDADGDGDVDMDDYGEFQKCYTGPGWTGGLSLDCGCLDSNGDGAIDQTDYHNFVDCETGASVPWVVSTLTGCMTGVGTD